MISAKRRIWLRPGKQRRLRLCRKFALCCGAKSGIQRPRAIPSLRHLYARYFTNLFASDLHSHGLAFAFAALGEPGGKALRKTFRSEPETSFHLAISHGKRVIKVSGVGEV